MNVNLALIGLAMLLMANSACSHSSGSSAPSAQKSPDKNGDGSQIPQPSPDMQSLKVFGNDAPVLNEAQAVNVNPGKISFDFSYRPDQNESLALTNAKPILLGCDNSSISYDFNLYLVGSDGNVDLASSFGFGPSPTPVKKDVSYVVRLTLNLTKACQGLVYDFAVQAEQ